MMKNYNFSNWHCVKFPASQQISMEGKRPSATQNILKGSWKASLILSFFLSLFLTQEISAQASFYTFAQSNGSYTPITGGTVLTTSTSGVPNLDSYVSASITIPTFTFAGVAYTNIYVTGNGLVSLGATAPSTSTYTVLSSTTGGNVFLAPLSADLDDNIGVSEIRHETIGDEFVVQWTNFRRYAIVESINFQVRINTVTGVIQFVYDGTPPYGTSTSYQPQVGIKSAVGSYNALTVATTGDWNSPVNITSGIVAGSVATFRGNVGPSSGLTYTWTPGLPTAPNCATALLPADLSTNTPRNPTLTWTDGGANPTSYDVYFGTSPNPPLIGNQVGTTYNPVALLPSNTTYYWKVVPKNAIGEATGCTELSFTTGSTVLYCTPSSTGSATYINNFATTLGTTNISNASGYTTGGYQDNYASAAVTSVPTGSFSFNMTVTGGTMGAAIWVDWNSNGTFEATERVYVTTTASSGPFTGSISIPAGTPVGDYRMRVMVDFSNGAPSNPCNTTTARTETEDYKITVEAQPACSGTPTAATIASSLNSVCISGSVTLTATIPASTDSGFTYQWYNTAGAIAGATASTFTTPILSAPESYFFKTTCTNSGLSANSNTVAIAVNNPQVLTTTPGSRCGAGTVNLAASTSAGATLNWYSTATGGTAIGTGTTFTTPSISTTTDFYVSATEGTSTVYGGVPSPIGTSSYADGTTGLVFSATTAFTLYSVVVYNNGAAGTLVIKLTNSSGTVLETSPTFSVPAGSTSNLAAYTANLNWNIPVGSGYRLMAASGTTVSNSSLVRDSSGSGFGSYPFALGTVGNITGGYFSGSSTSYYNFYNWRVSADCTSARTAVTATVDTAPALTLSNTSSSICSGTETNAVTIATGASNYDTFVWSPSTGVTGNAADGFVFNPTTTTTYTLTASQSTGSLCITQVTHTVNVNELPSAVIISPATATTCANSIQALTATGGTISASGSTTIGTDTTVTAQNGLEPTAFCNRYDHYWLQMVFTQAELNAAGIQAGTINGIKFNITTIGSADFVTDYRVKVGSTTENELTGFITTGLQEVFSAATYNQTLGVNSIAFSTPYVWDGTSNIILDIRNTGADSSNNASTYYTATTLNRAITARTSTPFASSDAFAASNPPGTLTLKRLNTTFDWTSPAATDITWSPVTNLFTDAAATVAYVSGTAAATVYVKSATAGAQTYTATATSPSGCATTGTVEVTTTAASAEPTASAQTFCSGATVADLVATGADLNWYTSVTGGTVLANTAVLTTGSYYVSQTLNACESTRVLVDVTVNAAPTATITRADDTLTVSEVNATYQWINCDDSSPIAGATSQSYIATATGSYAVMVTENGCTVTSDCFEITTLSNNKFDFAKLGYYPNPVNDVLTVTHSEIISSIRVYDVTGRLVRQMNPNNNEVQVDMTNMPASIYIVKVSMENTSGEFKVIKK